MKASLLASVSRGAIQAHQASHAWFEACAARHEARIVRKALLTRTALVPVSSTALRP